MTDASTAETLTATGMREVTELAAVAVQDPEATQEGVVWRYKAAVDPSSRWQYQSSSCSSTTVVSRFSIGDRPHARAAAAVGSS